MTGPIVAVYYVQLSHAITFPFLEYFQILYIFVHFCSTLLCSFSEQLHPCPYFLE